MGYLNGRTNIDEDFITDNTDNHSHINMTMYNKDPINSFLLSRENADANNVDEQGRLILDLCKSSGMRILNGRTQVTNVEILRDTHGTCMTSPALLIMPYAVTR